MQVCVEWGFTQTVIQGHSDCRRFKLQTCRVSSGSLLRNASLHTMAEKARVAAALSATGNHNVPGVRIRVGLSSCTATLPAGACCIIGCRLRLKTDALENGLVMED